MTIYLDSTEPEREDIFRILETGMSPSDRRRALAVMTSEEPEQDD